MKLAVTSIGNDLDGEIDPRFGRCQYFLIIDSETMEFEVLENRSAMAMGGAGPQATEVISKKGAEVIITGNVGPNAFEALKAAGIKVITGASGTVKEMVEKFNRGALEEILEASVDSHSGMKIKKF